MPRYVRLLIMYLLVMALPATFHPLNLGGCPIVPFEDPHTYGGNSASQGMSHLSGSPYATHELPLVSYGSQNAQLYLDVFQKYSRFYRGSSRRQWSTTFKGMSHLSGSPYASHELLTMIMQHNFQCRRRLVDLPQTTTVADFCSEETTNSELFWKYTKLCATSVTTTCSINSSASLYAKDPNRTSHSISNHRRRTSGNSQAIPTTDEVGTSKRVRRPPVTSSIMSVGHSNRLPPILACANTEGYTSVAGASKHLLHMLS
nr:hypothetical protein [Tanacetum cinerariifolium]GEZ51041.1 hypothetical protein [Tanacetum cinerariifolium]